MADTQNWNDTHHVLVTTRTGIKIGSAYTRPAPRELGTEAERIQSALLARRTPVLDALMKWLGVWK